MWEGCPSPSFLSGHQEQPEDKPLQSHPVLQSHPPVLPLGRGADGGDTGGRTAMVCGGDKGLTATSALHSGVSRRWQWVIPCLAARRHSLPKTGGKQNGQSLGRHFQRTLLPRRQKPIAFPVWEPHASPPGEPETKRLYPGRQRSRRRTAGQKHCESASAESRKDRPECPLSAALRGHQSSPRQREEGEEEDPPGSKPVGRMALEARACPDSVGTRPHEDVSLHPEVQGRPGRAPGPGYWELTDTMEPEGSDEGKWPRVWPRSHAYKSGDGSAVAKQGTKVARTQLREGAAKMTQE